MAIATIGEYRDAKQTARGFISEQEVDFTSGETASVAFNADTRSIRVCSDVAHRFKIGAAAEATSTSQRRPADAVEYHDVEQGRGWVISFLAE